MKRVAVDSSSIASVGYDSKAYVLEIEFRNGGVYRYLDVPAQPLNAVKPNISNDFGERRVPH